jgi:hypothetical protein
MVAMLADDDSDCFRLDCGDAIGWSTTTAARPGGGAAAETSEENLLTLAFDLPSPPSDPARAAVDAAADSAGALKTAAEADELPNVPSDLRGSGGGRRRRRCRSASQQEQVASIAAPTAIHVAEHKRRRSRRRAS